MKKSKSKRSTINQQEIAKFSSWADEWWDLDGKFKPLHEINHTRLKYIKDQICTSLSLNGSEATPFNKIKILDVGCGGGLLSEPLTRLGAEVTGIDAGERNIEAAKIHAKKSRLEIDYRVQMVEELADLEERFDVVLALEIVEHVENVDLFIKSLCTLVRKGGMIILSTINRNPKSYLFAIIGAEYFLRWLPIGTHEWRRFLKPSELSSYLDHNGYRVIDVRGMSFDLFSRTWVLSDDISINYLLVSKKE